MNELSDDTYIKDPDISEISVRTEVPLLKQKNIMDADQKRIYELTLKIDKKRAMTMAKRDRK